MAERNGVIAIIVIGLILVAAVYLINNTNGPRNQPQPTQYPNTTPPSTSNATSNASTHTASPYPTYPNTSSVHRSNSTAYSCATNASTVFVYNGNFSTGTYYGWSVYGNAFGAAPLNLTMANNKSIYYQNEWSGYAGTYAATTYRPNAISLPSNLSANFVVVKPYLNFQIYSPYSSGLYVEILFDGKPAIVRHYNTLNGTYTNSTSTFAYASINMSSLMCNSVTLRIVSDIYHSTTDNQNLFIAVGNFYQSSLPYQTPGIAADGVTP